MLALRKWLVGRPLLTCTIHREVFQFHFYFNCARRLSVLSSGLMVFKIDPSCESGQVTKPAFPHTCFSIPNVTGHS